MHTIALVNQKGGCGKSTVAIHLAAAFALAGEDTLLLDLDPQRSTAMWGEARRAPIPVVEAVMPDRLRRVFDHARQIETKVLVCDTAPHNEATALEVARLADLVIVPCQPSIMDIRAMKGTTDLLRTVQAPAVAVLNAVPATGPVAAEAEFAIANDLDLPVCPARLGDRVSFRTCMISGQVAQEYEPHGKAAHEVERLHAWIADLIKSWEKGKWQREAVGSPKGSRGSGWLQANRRWLTRLRRD